MPYLGDNKILPRVRKYLESKSTKLVDSESVSEHLQNTYQEYRRKNKNAFRRYVSKALDIITKEYEEELEDSPDIDVLSAKRPLEKKKNVTEESTNDSDNSLSDDAVYTEYHDSNAVNSLVTHLYAKSPSDPSSPAGSQLNSVKRTGFIARCQSDPVLVDTGSQLDGLAFIDRGSMPGTPVNPSKLIESLPASPAGKGRSTFKNINAKKSDGVPSSQTKPVVMTISDDDEDGDESGLAAHSNNERNVLNTGKRKNVQTVGSHKKKSRNSEKLGSGGKTPKPDSSGPTPGPSRKKGAIDAVYSQTKFSQIGGNEKTIKEIQQLLIYIKYAEIYKHLGATPPQGFLLHGPPGCGKTLMAHAIAGELGLPFYKLAATELVSGVSGESEERVRSLFNQAASTAPCIVFIDEVDSITPKRETASKDMERRIVSQLLTCLDSLGEKKDVNVLIIGATNRPDSLDPALRRSGRFDREICMGIPDVAARESILKVLCQDIRLSENFDFSALSRSTPGYVGADLSSLVQEAAMSAVSRILNSLQDNTNRETTTAVDADTAMDTHEDSQLAAIGSVERTGEHRTVSQTQQKSASNWWNDLPTVPPEQFENMCILYSDFQEALKRVQPSAKREGFATVPDVSWDDIGALKAIREELHMAILAPVKYPEQSKALGLNTPSGVLLAGPPGCGKTLLAKAIANESGINFISVKGPELINMYVGESEKAVRQVFQRARNSSPCVVFFDELDSLCPKRSLSGSDGGSGSRVVNQLLTEMDGLEERKQVFVMGATNRPDIIDPAILRPGRLDKTLYVGLPTLEDRLDILTTITRNCSRPPIEGVDLAEIAARCEKFSGADLNAVIREASMAAMKEFISTQNTLSPQLNVCLTKRHFDVALEKVKPSISAKDQARYEAMKGK